MYTDRAAFCIEKSNSTGAARTGSNHGPRQDITK